MGRPGAWERTPTPVPSFGEAACSGALGSGITFFLVYYHRLCFWGSLGLLFGERETGVGSAPCGLQREFRTRRSPPTQALAQALQGDYACCRLREGSFSSRGIDGCAVSFRSMGTRPPD